MMSETLDSVGQTAKHVAVPPIGTKGLGYDAAHVAKWMIDSITSYLSTSTETTIEKVEFCVLPTEPAVFEVCFTFILRMIHHTV